MTNEIVEVDPWSEVITNIIGHTTNLDFYSLMAAFFFERKVENVSQEQRKETKLLMYSIKYGRVQEINRILNDLPIPGEAIERHRNKT